MNEASERNATNPQIVQNDHFKNKNVKIAHKNSQCVNFLYLGCLDLEKVTQIDNCSTLSPLTGAHPALRQEGS